MSDVVKLLSHLRRLDIKLELNEGKLKVNAPKGALNDEIKNQLAENKEAILAFLKQSHEQPSNLLSIPAAPKDLGQAAIPATDSQARFWFLEKFSPGDTSFNIPALVEIRGELDESLFQESVKQLIERHESLRLCFKEIDGQPFLDIQQDLDWQLLQEVVHVSTQAKQQEYIAAESKALLSTGFDLSQAPLMRIKLVQLEKGYQDEDTRTHYILFACVHHIVCDGWSIDIILRDLSMLYIALVQGQPAALPNLDINFSDYAYWCSLDEQRKGKQALIDFWKQNLEQAKGLLGFPYDRVRPLKPSSEGSSINFAFDAQQSKRINSFCRHHGLTPFMFFIGVYQLCISKYTKDDDICVGIPIAGRTRQEIENIVGLFLNALIIRNRTYPECDLETYFAKVKSNTLQAFDHQDLALDTLIDHLDIDREHEEVPGVQFGFIFQNTHEQSNFSHLSAFESDDLSLRPLNLDTQTSKHDICLTLREVGDCFKASVEYRSRLLDKKSIERFIEHYEALVHQILEQEKPLLISDLYLFSKESLCEQLGTDSKVDAIVPLTASQEGFYLNDLIREDSQSTLIGTSILVQGDLDIDRWQQALQDLHSQRSVLRMQIYPGQDKLHALAYQVVFHSSNIDFEIIDARSWTLEEAQEHARQIIYTPFVLQKASLIRYRVLCLSDSRFLLVTAMHHSLMDAVSALQHWVEAQALYEGKQIAEDNYLDYLYFAQSQIDSEQVLAHWREQLKGVDAPDYSVHGEKSHFHFHEHGERQLKRLMVEGEQWQSVKHYCRRQGITPAILYKVVFAYLLESYCQTKNNFYINEIITGRPGEFSKTLGNCFLIQPFIFDIDNFSLESDVSDAFNAAKQQQKHNRQFAYLSQRAFENLQSKGRVAFYYNYLTFMPPDDFLEHPVNFRDWGNEIDEALEFNPRLGPDGLELNLFYREGLFRESCFLESIQYLIDQLVSGVSVFGRLNFFGKAMLPQDACASLLTTPANQLQVQLEHKPQTVIDLFLQQVKQDEHKMAVVCGEQGLSYAELEKASAQIANFLVAQTIKPGERVVIDLAKSTDFIASILGILRAGAQYLPLDESLPEERKVFIREDSEARVIIDVGTLQACQDYPSVFHDKAVSTDSPAYTIYTSGSTGVPKGVQVSHGPLLRTYLAWQEAFFLDRQDRHLQMASVGFDVFTGDWVRALCSGARLYLVDKETLMDAQALIGIITHEAITIAEFVPAVLRNVMQLSEQQGITLDLRMLMVGSDAWFESDQVMLENLMHEDCLLVNSYGVTEAVIDSSYSIVKAKAARELTVSEHASVSIGQAFANTSLYIMDEAQRLLPKEVAGELYIAGMDLADGYVNDKQKTDESFLKDALNKENPQARMYRSGDRVKLCQNGDLILLGRIGQQVKIRGFRVELGEIENQLNTLAEVEECVVLAQEDEFAQKSLVAYVVFKNQNELSIGELRSALSKHLPDYMLPQLCIALDQIPLNANGKLDRNALPQADFSQAKQHDYLAPRNQTESLLLEIWQSVLGLERIGVNDNFFELGGHSLLASQLVSRIKQQFEREVAIKAVFESPTIAEQANLLEVLLSRDLQLSAPEIVAVERKELMPVSYAQQRFWFLDRLVPGFFAYNMPFGIRVRGDLDKEAFQSTLDEILRRHESLRCQFVSRDDEVFASVSAIDTFPLSYVDVSKQDEKEKAQSIQKQIEQNAHKPFSLDKDLLIRCSLIKSDVDEYLILACMHHIISDGWSIRILFQEIALLYNAFSQGRPSPLADLKLHYLDFAAWEQSWLQGETLERYIDFWLESLHGAPEILKLPTDKPRPQAQTFNGKQIVRKSSLAFRHKLEHFAKQENVSLFMTLIAAMSILMSRYTKENDILIGTPVAGRSQLATESMIGLFLNAVIIRSQLKGNPDVSRFLQSVKDTCLSVFAHQEMPAEILYERVANHRNPQYPAGAQVGLVLQNTATRQNRIDAKQFGEPLQGLRAELLGTEQVISNYDFGFTVIEQEDGLEFIAEFNTDLFFDTTIEKMLDQYLYLIEQMIANPQSNIDALLLQPQEALLDELGLDNTIYKDVLPLTAMQEGMFLANKLNPYSKEYSVGFSVRIRQSLNVDLWNSSLQGLIDTQDVARVVFYENSKPYLDDVYQLVKKEKQANVEFVDWSGQGKSEQEIEELASRFINAPYNILKDDLIRVMLIKVNDDYFVGVFAAHHILLDGIAVVAFGVMGAMNYELVHNGGQAIVHEDKYKEYLLLNQEQMDTWDIQNFWREELQNLERPLEALEYPVNTEVLLDMHKPPEKFKKSLRLDSQHWEAVKQFCKQNRITPALYFKALYALVLSKYCRSENDFYIFEILAGRPAGHMNALGCYFQQIPVRMPEENFRFDALIADLFKALRQQQKRSKHKQLISVPLQLDMLPEASVSFMYNFEHYIPDFYFMGQPVEIQEYSNQVNGIVQLLVKTLADTVQLNLQSQQGFFDDFNMLERMEALSKTIISGAQRIGELCLLDEQEKAQILQIAQGRQSPYSDLCVHELIEKAVLEFPENIAVRDSIGSYCYSELNEQANQLAHYLQAQGVQEGDCVGVCLPLCKEVPLAILAILKCGAAYLPMDSRYPEERLNYFIEAAKPKRIVSIDALIDSLFKDSKHQPLFYSLTEKSHLEYPENNLDLSLTHNALLYVLFTSGSTGKPNATGTYHYCEVNLIEWYCSRFQMSSSDKLLIISAMGFDLTQKNLMAPLVKGAQIIFNESDVYDDQAILENIASEKITWINCAPSAFYPLLAEKANYAKLSSLRWVFLGGEAINLERLHSWYQDASSKQCRVVNTYGPSECTDIASFYVLEQGQDYSPVPIGQPNNNVQLYVLDQHRQLIPRGLIGELYVGGVGVGAQYLNNPDLNKQRFFANPFAKGLMYKTGDLVRLNENKQIDYIGRSDFQIKVRGIRIEPGELENRINKMTAVQDSLVLLNEDDVLVAYILSPEFADDGELLIQNIQTELRRYFNSAIIPSLFMVLDSFPLSPNGKVDRQALPKAVQAVKEYVAPESEIEKGLAAIWEDILSIDQVSRYDNFFEIGGHSLLAVQLVSRINKAFGVSLPLAILFEAQNLDSLAIKLESYSHKQWQPLVTLQQEGEKMLFCIHPVGGEVLCYRDLARNLGKQFSVYAIQASGLMPGQDVISDPEQLVQTYADLIAANCGEAEVYLAGQSIGGVFAIAIAQELLARNKRVAMLALFDSFVPNDKNLEQIGISHLRSALGAFMQIDEQGLQKLSELEQLSSLFEQAKQAYLIPQDIEFSQISSRYLLARANIAIAQALELQTPVSIPCLHVEAEQSLSGLSSAEGWEDCFTTIKFIQAKGDHESILHAENVKLIANALSVFSSELEINQNDR